MWLAVKYTPVSLLANELDVRSVIHGQVSLVVVNHFYVIHEAMNGWKILKVHYRIASILIEINNGQPIHLMFYFLEY